MRCLGAFFKAPWPGSEPMTNQLPGLMFTAVQEG